MISTDIFKRLYVSALGLFITFLVGTFGYWFITDKQYAIFDCFYLTFITITTIGFGEILPLQDYPGARFFTVIIALVGIGFITYFISTFAATIIEGYFKQNYERSKMEKDISKLQDHYILCGLNTYTGKIVEELSQTHRDHVIIEQESESIEDMKNNFKGESYIEGDPTEDEILKKAGIDRAKGVFAATNDDNINLVISLSAKRLNPKLRVIAFSFKQKNMEKMILAGADKVVSPTTIGGMRMASEMIRPTVTNFLDYMLRDSGKSFRIEEVIITDDYHGKKLVDVDINDLKSTVLMAIRTGEDWRFKPDEDSIINKGDILIVMTTPEERIKLEKMFD